MLVSHCRAQPYDKISTVQQQSTCIWYRAHTRSGQETNWLAACKKWSRGVSLLVLFENCLRCLRTNWFPKLLQTGAKDQTHHALFFTQQNFPCVIVTFFTVFLSYFRSRYYISSLFCRPPDQTWSHPVPSNRTLDMFEAAGWALGPRTALTLR